MDGIQFLAVDPSAFTGSESVSVYVGQEHW